MAFHDYLEPRLRPNLLVSELCCWRITAVRGVFVLHALFSSNFFVLRIFEEKKKNKRHCSEQTIRPNWEIKKEDSSCYLLLVSVLHRQTFIFLGFVLMCSTLFHSLYEGLIIGNAGYVV